MFEFLKEFFKGRFGRPAHSGGLFFGSESTSHTVRIDELEARVDLLLRYSPTSYWRAVDIAYDRALENRHLRCIVCGHADLRKGFETRVSECRFEGGKLERYVCPECECVFGPQKFLDLPKEYVDLEYQLAYSKYQEADSTENEIRTFNSLQPLSNGTYVNWGCGQWSHTIGKLRAEGWQVWGYEPTLATKPPFVATQRSELPGSIFGIFSNNVIEHFLDPIAQFEEFHKLLPSGGLMAHSSPCYEYAYEYTRFHTLFLLGRSPEILASRTGFRVVDRTKDGEYINVVFQKI